MAEAAEAVVGGVADGLRAVTPEGEEPPADLDALRALLATAVQAEALPAATADESEPAAKAKARK